MKCGVLFALESVVTSSVSLQCTCPFSARWWLKIGSTLCMLPVPQGVLPVEYLHGTDFDRAEGLFANAQQIVAQYQVSHHS